MDANDPPLYLYNPVYEDEIITEGIKLILMFYFIAINMPIFKKKAIKVGLEYSGAYQESPIDFIKEK